jgi:hypothetical protein
MCKTNLAGRASSVAAQRMTSPAWKRRVGGMVNPKTWAVFRLMTSSVEWASWDRHTFLGALQGSSLCSGTRGRRVVLVLGSAMIPSTPASTAACASSIDPTWRHTVMPRRGASSTSGRGWVPETSAALPCSSSRVEPPDHCPYTDLCRVVPLSTSGPQGPRGERRRARRARAWAHEPPGRRAPWSVRMRRCDPPPVVNRRLGRPGPTPAAEAVNVWSGHRAQS